MKVIQHNENIKEFANMNKFIIVFKTNANMGISINENIILITGVIIDIMEHSAKEGKMK